MDPLSIHFVEPHVLLFLQHVVDDLANHDAGEPDTIFTRVLSAAAILKAGLDARKLRISDKTTVTASFAAPGRKVVQALEGIGVPASYARAFKDLRVAAASG